MTKRPPLEDQKASLLDLARRTAPKPLLIGCGAVHLGWWASLPETEAVLESMVKEGVLRHATRAELREWGLRFGYMPVA
jgi:hypothetical protein